MKVIVTTTINPPNDIINKFLTMDWDMIVVGDLKTPHQQWSELEQKCKNLTYMHPIQQENKYKALSDAIGWNKIQRRNIGFVEAYHRGASIVATIDDDNMPLDNWGKDILLNSKIRCNFFNNSSGMFDPLSATSKNELWHRGYPIEQIKNKNNITQFDNELVPLVQANLWNGDPDIDAICRLANSNPKVEFLDINPYSTDNLTPFNSQNTFLSREVLKFYTCLPFCGRMDDIWGGYLLQYFLRDKTPFIVFDKPTVYQDRSLHSFDGINHTAVHDLEREILGYHKTGELVKNLDNWRKFMYDIDPKISIFIDEYQKAYDKPEKPYMSIVCTGRNDDYGGNYLRRYQNHINSIFNASKDTGLKIQIVYIEWNPVKDKPYSFNSIVLPKGDHISYKFLIVSEDTHKSIGNSGIPVHEYIAKNTGIKHADGDVILSTNPDIIFTHRFFKWMAKREVIDDVFYNCSRSNVKGDVADNVGNFVNHIFLPMLGTVNIPFTNPDEVAVLIEQRYNHLYTVKNEIFNCCPGDFTMLTKKSWKKVNGYREFNTHSVTDSILLQDCVRVGMKQHNLPLKMTIFHQDHHRHNFSQELTTKYQESLNIRRDNSIGFGLIKHELVELNL